MRVIRASEIGEYVFCHRAWWLHQLRGLASANARVMEAGTEHHAAHGLRVWLASALRVLAFALGALAILTFIASLLGFDLWHLGF